MPRRPDAPREAPTRRRLLAVAGSTAAAAALAGCQSTSDSTTERAPEGTVTVTLANRDDTTRDFEVVVNQGTSLSDRLTGVLPGGESVEMVATFRITDEQYDFTINTDGGQRGRTWDPSECGDLVVDATIRNGEPRFETRCPDS